ncbi:aldo/keto reductase [Mesoaciditoga sp.]
MRRMRLGNTEINLPVVGIGTWGMGGKFEADHSRDEETAKAIIKAVKLGMNHIDTAEFYGNGHTEEIVGMALQQIKRDEVFITSKIWPTHLNWKDALNSIKATLKKLGTDHVDLYLIHWPSAETNIKESIDIMNSILDKGYTRYIGVSNFSIAEVEKAVESSKAPIVCDQIRYNIQDRSAKDSGLIDYCMSRGISIVAYSPLNRMEISSSFLKKLKKIAQNRGATPVQIALAWITTQGIFTIPKAVNDSHIIENAKAGDILLSDDEMDYLKS